MASLAQFGLFVLLLHIISPSKCDELQIFQNTNPSSDALLNIPTRLVALEQTMAITIGELQEDRSNCKKEKEIVEAIKQGRFTIVEEKMLALNDMAVVADIICDMSENSDHDFGVLVNLAKSLNSSSLKRRILLSLYHQVKESDHISTLNLVALAKCLSEKAKGYQDDEIISISSFKKLLGKIAENIIATFVDVMKWQEDYQTNTKVRALAADIAEWRDVSETVMIGLVSRTFGIVDSNKILEAVSNHTDAWQALVGVDTLIERLKAADSLKGSVPLYILSHINKFVTRTDLHSTVQYYARQLTDKIPDYIVKIASLLNGEFGTLDRNEFFKEVCNQTDSMQVLLGVETLIEWLKDTDSFKGTIAWNIASYLKEFVTRKELNSIVREYALRVQDKIPDCIAKLLTFKNVCIRCKYKPFFLRGSGFYYKMPETSVVIGPRWSVRQTQISALWRHTRKDERVFLDNVAYDGHLYSSNITVADMHIVLISMQKHDLDEKNAWTIEPAGDSCFFKNYLNNEYLYVSDENFSKSDQRKFVGTKDRRSGSADENPEFVWKIMSC